MPTFLRIIVYPIFAVVCLIFFSLILFPFDSVKTRLVNEMQQGLGDQYVITVKSLSPALMTGAVLKDVEIRSREAQDETPLKISRAKFKIDLLPLLSGKVEVAFDVKPSQGRASGFFSIKKGGFGINLVMDQFDVALANFFTRKKGVSLSGQVNGDVNLEIYFDDPLRNLGTVSLKIPDLSLGEMKIGGAFAVPAFRLARAGESVSTVELEVNRGNFEIKSIKLIGGDVGLDINGKVYGARRFDNYRFNITGNATLSDELINKMPILTVIQKMKQPDGSYPLSITGRVQSPSIRIGDFKLPI